MPVVEIKRGLGEPCTECEHFLPHDDFAAAINHYIDSHRYRLVNVVQVTEEDEDVDDFVQRAIAVLQG